MKLYIYDHCPYCVRPRIIAGLKNVPIELVYPLNDDEQTPISLVGKKLVPILIKENGEPMGESLDITAYLDNLDGKPMLSEIVRPEIQQWFDDVSSYYYRLLHPRCVKLGLPEFATQGAIDYFVNKKSARIGDFNENLAESDTYIERLTQDLQRLETLVKTENSLNDSYSYEDILVFPMLRNLTMVKGLVFPSKVKTYLDNLAQASQIPLYQGI